VMLGRSSFSGGSVSSEAVGGNQAEYSGKDERSDLFHENLHIWVI
jgi:hypothetical protein